MQIRHAPLFALVAALTFTLGACGGSDDSPTAPRAGNLTVSVEALEWGTAPINASITRSFSISVDASETRPVSGDVTLAPGTSPVFTFDEGAGPFTLEPGESLTIGVTYRSSTPGFRSSGTVDLGVEGMTVDLDVFASEPPTFSINPTSRDGFDFTTNYEPFRDGVTATTGSGRTYGAGASWIQCASSGGWTFNGQGVTESTVSFAFPRPSGASSVRVRMGREAEGSCTQVLIEIDGDENRYENQTGCDVLDRTFSSSQAVVDVAVGTDQQGFCGDDLHVRWIEVSFPGVLVPPSEWPR